MIKHVLFPLMIFLSFTFGATSQDLESGYLRSDNDSLFYEVKGSGPVIVLIHDGLIHREVWDAQIDFFADHYKLVRYDRRGYGKSSPAQGTYSHLEDLNRLFDHLDIDSACLIGASSGGRLAIDFTLAHPEKVTALVLVGAVVGGYPYTRHFIYRGGHMKPGMTDPVEIAMYYTTEDPYEIYEKNTAAREKAMELSSNNPTRILNRETTDTGAEPAYRRLHEIRVPALVMVGEYDIPDVHAHSGVISSGIRNSRRIIISDAGHLIPLEQPEQFNNNVAEFLEQASPV